MDTEYVQTQCVLADGAERFGIAAIAFDQHEELIWMGNEGGHVTSYYGGMMQKYTSFQVHGSLDIRQLMPIDEGILALTASTLRCQIRRGIPLFTYTSGNMSDMQCMLQVSPDRLLIGGHQDKLIDFNLALYKESHVVHVGDAGCVMLRTHNRFVCAGDPVGRIDLRDPNTLNIEHTLESHTGSLSDFDVQGNLLVTCGFSNRQGTLSVDRFLMVYDLRMMRAVTPIQVVVDPLLLRFLPAVSSRLAVVSTLGQVQLVDTVALSEPRLCLYQVDSPGAMCTAFDVSTSSQAMAFGDTSGSIHLLVCADEPIFNSYSRLTEHADVPPELPLQPFGIDELVPYASVPLPLALCPPLASDWPQMFMQTAYRRSPVIDPEILKTMKVQGPIGYAPNPKQFKRNQVPYNMEHLMKIYPLKKLERNGYDNNNGGFVAIPKRYRRVDVKYTKLGTDDFPFEQYNKTGLPGLEATLPNAYCNAMLQVLYYTETLRAALLSHLCPKEFCLSCELGFLFHMLMTSRGAPCQPANFLRAFRTVPEASALSLILSDLHPEAKLKTDLGSLIQSWNRFILHQMHCELLDTKKRKHDENLSKVKPFVYKDSDFPSIHDLRYPNTPNTPNTPNIPNNNQETVSTETEISHLFGMKQLQMNCCLKCGHEVRKESILLACNLVYPSAASAPDPEWSFCDLLCSSLCPHQTTPAWCDACDKFSPTSQARILNSLPKILVINTGLHNAQYKQFWQTQIDKIVAKATIINLNDENIAEDDEDEDDEIKKTLLIKQCRYGVNCARPGCRFRHETPATPAHAQTTTNTNTNTNNPYYNNTWLPHDITMSLDKDSHLSVIKQTVINKDEIDDTKKYSLSAVVCYINDNNQQSPLDKRNIVALIRKSDKWYLFNDISISEVSAQEAVWFSLDWKIPCVLYYSSEQILNATPPPIQKPITLDVFGNTTSTTTTTTVSAFTPLTSNEIPKPGELVAMDAEFVTLNQEEAELRSDGKMSTIKPSHMSVARITCIRGQGALEGTPFIDDYISTQEQVVDYLTKFSGIKPGDLDANFSSKHLTTLKSTYQKLRFLQDSGVVFVGHGLKNDFRVINLVVPPEQVVDTVLLFHLPHHRMVSLRFLAWHFLGLRIQSETHDSIEDARAALQLYKRYKELEDDNTLAKALTELYETGKVLHWKVPDPTTTTTTTTTTF